MPLDVQKQCPNCGLVLLCGAIFDAYAQNAQYGPILGLSKEATKETAKAGYIGISSLFLPDKFREFYRCPRCGADPVFERSEHKG